ncbi:MAG TPA: HD domain-containing protein [Nannocystis sp.]
MHITDTSKTLIVARALEFAVVAHGDQTRKGTAIPYVSHLLQVSGLVLEWGGDVEQAAAALLHDVVEDTARTLAEVEAAFGPGVAAIVADCTDTEPDEVPTRKRPWLDRKRGYLEKLRSVGQRSALVIACDNLHNISTLLADLGREGVATLSRFNAPAPKQLWYFRAITDALEGRVPAGLHAVLAAHAGCFAALTGAVEWNGGPE